MSDFDVAPTKTTTRTSNWDQSIDLTDNTTLTRDGEATGTDIDESVLTALKRTGSRLNPTKLREEVARRRYANYSESRYTEETQVPAQGESRDALHRGRQKVKGLLDTRRRLRPGQDDDTAYDILYENQRGSWFFGVPKYSSKSLLNFDPPAWTNALGEPSGVDITNAQLPDPSWQWMWKTWYVDMSPDVDEQGWQYSIIFSKRTSWHGNHPWFHSWVRRRKWIRKRTRKQAIVAHSGAEDGELGKGNHAHHLNPDYFSVRPAKGTHSVRPASYYPSTSGTLGVERNVPTANTFTDDDDVNDIPTLLEKLKQCTMDREKINLVLKYMDQSSHDVNYLAAEMPFIISTLIYQHSRRSLIANMLKLIDDPDMQSSPVHESSLPIEEGSEISSSHGPRTGKMSTFAEGKHQNLLRAIKAADKEFENMEYWSDIREAEQRGESTGTAEKVIETDPPAGPESSS